MQDVLVTLLNNLKVQERQNRVCTTVAIAIVAETCSPFTVLPALMNEYKVSPFEPHQLAFVDQYCSALCSVWQSQLIRAWEVVYQKVCKGRQSSSYMLLMHRTMILHEAVLVQVPELNVQNGVLKALSFLFEYIGEMGKDYIYAVSPLLEDALMDRDLVSLL